MCGRVEVKEIILIKELNNCGYVVTIACFALMVREHGMK
jgi:hypothetical protein